MRFGQRVNSKGLPWSHVSVVTVDGSPLKLCAKPSGLANLPISSDVVFGR